MTAQEYHLRVHKRARFYTLGARETARDIWFVCHGYGQLAGKFITHFECIASAQTLIVAPEALHRFYIDPPPAPAARRRVGATWMTREDRENDIADNIDYLDQLVSEIASHAPAARVHALGFSQGTATLLRWAAHASKVPEHIVIWAGELPHDVDWSMAARRITNTRIDVVHGTRDEQVTESAVKRNLQALDAVGLPYEIHRFEGGHRLDDETLVRLARR